MTTTVLPNHTPVYVRDRTVHLHDHDAGGRRVRLVQALVWLDVQWCPQCFGKGRPR